MEMIDDAWERSIPFLPLNEADVKRLLGQFDANLRIISLQPLSEDLKIFAVSSAVSSQPFMLSAIRKSDFWIRI
jgi:hypothetical protein